MDDDSIFTFKDFLFFMTFLIIGLLYFVVEKEGVEFIEIIKSLLNAF